MAVKLTQEELAKHLAEQIGFLQSSAKLYDLGNEAEAKRMAVGLRVLLHDTRTSSSLLGQIHLKKRMQFISTAQKYDPTNLLSQQCLLMLRLNGNTAQYVPLFENNDRYRLLSFPDWSSEIVFSDQKKNLYRRKQVLKLLANQDGGAHVDPELDDDLAAMKKNDLTGWVITRADGSTAPFDNDAVYATMRQMTFEVLQSLYRVKPKLFPEMYF